MLGGYPQSKQSIKTSIKFKSGYVIHHINEYNLSGDNTINNIQALCPNCYAVKVNRFNKQKQHFTTSQLAIGMQYMDTSL